MTESGLTTLLVTVKVASSKEPNVDDTVVITPQCVFKVTPVVILVNCVTVPLSYNDCKGAVLTANDK